MNSIEMVFPPEDREVWNYLQRLLKPIALSNQQRRAKAARFKKEHKRQYLHLLTKITQFLECTIY